MSNAKYSSLPWCYTLTIVPEFFLLLALFRIVFQLWVNADNRFWYSIAKRVWERGRSWRQHYIWTQKRLRKLVRDWLIKLERHFILLSYSNFVLSYIIFSYINHAGCTCTLKYILHLRFDWPAISNFLYYCSFYHSQLILYVVGLLLETVNITLIFVCINATTQINFWDDANQICFAPNRHDAYFAQGNALI